MTEPVLAHELSEAFVSQLRFELLSNGAGEHHEAIQECSSKSGVWWTGGS